VGGHGRSIEMLLRGEVKCS
jgi:hypothetical protein